MKLTPEDLQRIEDKKIANILRKIYTEKRTPTAREDAILARAGVVQTPGLPATPLAGYAANWDELAQALGVSRRAIQEWRKDPRYSAHCPADRADGRKEVAAWLDLMIRFGLKRADEGIDENGETIYGDGADVLHAPRVGGTAVDWKKANLALDHRKKQNEISTQEGTLLITADLEMPLGATFAAIQTKLAQFPDRVARFVTGLRDVQEVADKLRDEMDADLSDLHAARYLQLSLGELVAALPFDENTERLFKLVTFDGQDHAALLELIAAVAAAALAQIGRKTIAQLRARESLTDEDLADSVTGQVTDAAASAESLRQGAAVPPASASGDRSQSAPPAPSAASESAHPVSKAPATPDRARSPRAKARSPAKAVRQKKAPAKPATPPRDVEPISAPRAGQGSSRRSHRSRR